MQRDVGLAGAALAAHRRGEESELADAGACLEAKFMLVVINTLGPLLAPKT